MQNSARERNISCPVPLNRKRAKSAENETIISMYSG